MAESSYAALQAELLELQRTLGWMDLVIGNITDAVYVTNQDSRLVFVNHCFSDIVHLPRIFLLGRTLDEVFSTKVKDDPNKQFLPEPDHSSQGDNQSKIYEWQYGDTQKIFSISTRHIETINQTVHIAKDITTEYALSVIKTNFINIASHQLRTPMTSIMTYSHMLYEGYGGELDENQKKLAERIVASSERMISLINDILLISRLQNGEENLRANDGKLLDIFDTLETELEPRIKDKSLDFVLESSSAVKNIKCNKFLIHEILMNLLTNGIQYTPRGGKIRMKVIAQANQLKIVVKDSGIGIPKDYMPKIFDQFTRAENAFRVFNEGTGLGLYIVKIIVELLNGNVACNSIVDKGTTFTVVLPI